MAQENKIIKWLHSKESSNRWFLLIFTQPQLYLYNLLKRTAVTGFVMLIVFELTQYAGITKQSIPSNLHSLVGMVIGLLLVFRTNTSYDRWWEARKLFSSFQASLLYVKMKSKMFTKSTEALHSLKRINSSVFGYVSSNNEKDSLFHKERFIKHCDKLSILFYEECNNNPNYGNLEKKISELIEQFCALERIKNTPIPTSYALHVKLSVFIYLLSLPFGLFFELGVFSVFLVMMLFFIIGGIEVISSEIENPFGGQPNDHPLDKYQKENDDFLKP